MIQVSPHLQLLHRSLGDTYISSLQLVFILQKQAIRRIHNVAFDEQIIPSIIYQTTKPLKLCDIIQLQSLIFMRKARNCLLFVQYPGHVSGKRERGENLRGKSNFETSHNEEKFPYFSHCNVTLEPSECGA